MGNQLLGTVAAAGSVRLMTKASRRMRKTREFGDEAVLQQREQWIVGPR